MRTFVVERYARCLGSYNPEEYIKVDAKNVPGVDIVYRGGNSLPFESESADEIICIHVLEHVQALEPDTEARRKTIWVPHCFSPSAFGMPTHVRHFTDATFLPFDESHGMRYEFDFHVKFAKSRVQVTRR